MLLPSKAGLETGHQVAGVYPFGIFKNLSIYLGILIMVRNFYKK